MSELAICPQCGNRGIRVSSRGYYSRGWPAKCGECGALAYDRPHGILITLSAIFELVGPPLLLFFWILFPGFASILAISSITLFIVLWRRQRGRPRPASRFHPITPDSSRLSRRLTYLTILIVLSSTGVLYFFASHRH